MWLFEIWQKIKDFFFGTNNTNVLPSSRTVKKKFTVHNSAANRRTGKRFEITSESQLQTSTVQRRGKIRITGESRPQRCPLCGSKNTITRAQTGNTTWECSEAKKGCGNKW